MTKTSDQPVPLSVLVGTFLAEILPGRPKNARLEACSLRVELVSRYRLSREKIFIRNARQKH